MITRHGVKLKVQNEDWFDHKAKVISHYFIRGIDPTEWKQRLRERGEAGETEVRRGGLDIFYVIEERDKK